MTENRTAEQSPEENAALSSGTYLQNLEADTP